MSPGGRGTPPIPSTQFGVAPARATPQPMAALSQGDLGDATAPTSGDGLGLAAGTMLGHYELIRELGRGGMGLVYLARDLKLGRRVAIKFLLNSSREVAERFLVEARATAQCNHENIVIIHEVAEHHATPYMVLEYIEGKTLREIMGGDRGDDEGVRLPPSRVLELGIPIARALARAHELGIVHRDLKPENVLVTDAGQVKVLDFGIAKALGGASSGRAAAEPSPLDPRDLTHTREGAIVGTLPYMAPEQLGSGSVDHRADVWALGIILFEMLAGRHPVEPLTSDALFENLLDPSPLPSIRKVVPDVPAGLARVVDGCLDKSRDARTGSAAMLSTLLEELLRGPSRALAADENPYPGLTAFQEADANRFFGRARDVARGVIRIRESSLVGIVGPSGVGKSSFVRAGVGPALKTSGERWEIITLRPGRAPLSSLASVVERVLMRSTPGAGRHAQVGHEALITRIRAEPGFLGAQLRGQAREAGGNLLLFVDQFEELYTLVPDAAERRAFTAAIAGVADDPAAPLRVALSMRSDFLDRVAEDPAFFEELTRGLLFLAPPDRDGLREALVQPIEMVGYRFETSAMVGDMLDALAETPGALPLLQFTAAKLWDARDRDRRLLTNASYQAIGGISGALATHADEVIAAMNATSQRLAQRVFRQLVTPERTRAIVELPDLRQAGDGDELTRVIDQLVAARLLVVQTRADGGGGSVEIVHESLIDRWPTLRRWLDEDQEDAAFLAQLAAAAKQWDARGRPAGLLWRGDAIDEARRWHAQRPRSIPPRDEAFLQAAFSLARRGQRMRRIALVVAFAVLGTVAAGAMVAYVRVQAAEETAHQERRTAELAAQRAEEEAQRAKAALAASATAQEAEARAQAERARATEAEQATKGQLNLTAQELARANEELEKKAREANEARLKAESASKDSKRSAAEAQRLAAELQKSLDREKAKVRALEEEKKKLTTKLKD